MSDKKEVELHNGEAMRRRLTIDASCTILNVPVDAPDGYGQITYMDSGLHTDDGIKIWTPQSWERQ